MRLKMPAVLFLAAALLAGCIAGEATPRSDRSPPQEPPAPVIEPAESRAGEEIFVDDPDSPYPMTVESWSVDMDGDGTEELVELRAEKGYFSNETEPDKWFEGEGMHPYTLVVTRGETIYELPLGWKDNGFPPLNPIYWDEERTGRGWTQDQDGRPVLVLWFDGLSRVLDVYAVAFQDGKPVFLPVPEDGLESMPERWIEWYN